MRLLTLSLMLFLSLPAWAQVVLTDDAASAVMNEEVQTESMVLKILGGLLTILTPLLTALITLAVRKLHAEGKTSRLAYGGAVVGDFLLSGLAHFKQELQPLLQDALKDGVLDQQERTQLKNKLIEMAKRDLPADALKAAQAAFGPAFETWLSGQAERAIDSMASGAAPAPASP